MQKTEVSFQLFFEIITTNVLFFFICNNKMEKKES